MDKLLSNQQVHGPYNLETEAKLQVVQMRQEKAPYAVEILGVPIVVHENVFSPKYAEEIRFFIEKMVWPERKKVLEIGTGTGAIAVFYAKRGAPLVHATDINRSAVTNAQENLKKHGFDGSRYKTYYSNLFDDINGKFDIVNFVPPWIQGKAENDLEKAVLDEGFCTIKRFTAEVEDYLEPGGSVCLMWSNWSGIAFLRDLIERNGYQIQVFHEEVQLKEENLISYVLVLKKKEK